MSLSLAGKGAIITGGSRGIGLAIAQAFAREGASVSICARGAEGVAKAVASLREHGGTVHGAPCDLADKEQLDAYIDAANDAIGGVNILVCNASGFGRTDDETGWMAGIEIDILASVRASHAAVPLISANGGGSITHISTISALRPSLRTPPYGAVKAALNHYAPDPGAGAGEGRHSRQRHLPGLHRVRGRRLGYHQTEQPPPLRPHRGQHPGRPNG